MKLRIAVIGTGYLGATQAACMAELGYEVLGVDADPGKVERLSHGQLPFFEPELPALLRRHLSSGRLRFSTSLQEAAEFADVHFICVGTPQSRDGLAADVGQLFSVIDQLVPQLRRSTILIGKSTVPVGTAEALNRRAAHLAHSDIEVEVAWNPEFLREGHAVEDTLHPDRIVLGVPTAESEKVLREIYARQLDDGTPLVVTDVVTAELVKSASNAFLATKISFINAISELCEITGGDVGVLADALGHDPRIGRRFLDAGLGFGGGCLPKDIRALMARAGELGADQALSLLREVDAINMRRRGRMVDLAIEECGGSVLNRRIAALGAAFKPLTDDVRDSPALNVAAQLQLRGGQVKVYDPRANANAAGIFPTLNYVGSAQAAIEGAHLVLHLTEWQEFRDLDPAVLLSIVAEPRIVDGRNALDSEKWRSAGWTYRALGQTRLRNGPGLVSDSDTARGAETNASSSPTASSPVTMVRS